MKKNYIFFVEHAVFYKAQSLFYFNTELYAIKLSKKYFVDLCSKRTLVDVFGNMLRFLNCFQLELYDAKASKETLFVFLKTSFADLVKKIIFLSCAIFNL